MHHSVLQYLYCEIWVRAAWTIIHKTKFYEFERWRWMTCHSSSSEMLNGPPGATANGGHCLVIYNITNDIFTDAQTATTHHTPIPPHPPSWGVGTPLKNDGGGPPPHFFGGVVPFVIYNITNDTNAECETALQVTNCIAASHWAYVKEWGTIDVDLHPSFVNGAGLLAPERTDSKESRPYGHGGP